MKESSRRLKANKTLVGRPCGRCAEPLAFGEEAAICTACQEPYHAPCWEASGGCETPGCSNAPLQQLGPPPVPVGQAAQSQRAVSPGAVECPHCGRVFPRTRGVCPSCKQAPNPSGVYSGPKTNAPGAVSALVFGILSLIICGFVFGFFAISRANDAHRRIAVNPTLGGGGLANAGRILGILGIVANIIYLLIKCSERS